MKNIFSANSSISWWSIGLSILAANIAYDYIHVGASMGYSKGLALGSYEWTGSLAMIFVLLFVFPILLSTGVKTTPEYLGLRFGKFTRVLVAVVMVFLHIFVVMVPVLYSAAVSLTKWYGLSYDVWLIISIVFITLILLLNDFLLLIRINALLVLVMIITGLILVVYCFNSVGGVSNFIHAGAPRINAFLPITDDMLPWTSVVFGGLWVAHAYYWSINPFIQQFVLSSDTLSKAQFGFLLAATLKVVIPFIIMIPGITIFIVKGANYLPDTEFAFSTYITEIIPSHASGFILIIYLSTMIATFSSVGYSGINIVLNDILPASLNSNENAKSSYRIILLLFMLSSFIGALFFEPLGKAGLLHYNQVIMNAVTPSIVAIFGLGMFYKRTTSLAVNIALLNAIPFFFTIRALYPHLDFLNTGGIVFIMQCIAIVILSYFIPEKTSKKVFMEKEIRFERHLLVMTWSVFLVTLILSIYVILL
jgi:solute:Na+ symporter, SSS family